jgi:hypothetical protein
VEGKTSFARVVSPSLQMMSALKGDEWPPPSDSISVFVTLSHQPQTAVFLVEGDTPPDFFVIVLCLL